MHLGEVQVELVALPQHDKAQVRFCIRAGDGKICTVEFGKEKMLLRAVFGAANDTTSTPMDEFPHAVVGLNIDAAATVQAADGQASAVPLRPCTAFFLRGTDLFRETWGEAVYRGDRCDHRIKLLLGLLCLVVSQFAFAAVIRNLSAVWCFILPLLCLSFLWGAFLWILVVRGTWVRCVCAARLPYPARIAVFMVWATVLYRWYVTVLGLAVHVGIAMSIIIFRGLELPIDLSLARCGIRPVAVAWPFYRMLGFQGTKVPTLTLTVELRDEGLGHV